MYKIMLYICIICALLVSRNAYNQEFVEPNSSSEIATGLAAADLRGTPGVRPSAQTNRRVALVIGNGAYENEPKLSNPPNDAVDVARRLSALGFQVTMRTDLTRKQMRAEIAEFGRVATNAQAALFFYAGHAVQNDNQNFLLPVDVSTNSVEDVIDQSVNLSYILAELNRAKSVVNIVLLDACRTPQFTLKFRGNGMLRGDEQIVGLAKMHTQPDTMIVYATQPGNGAVDGIGGRNSPFTTGLLAALNADDLSLGGVLKTTSKRVKELTKGYQVPYTDGPRTLDDFQFAAAAIVPPVSTVTNSPSPAVTPPDPVAVAEPPPQPETVVPLPPDNNGISFTDLEAEDRAHKDRAVRSGWDKWQERMQSDFAKAAGFTSAASQRKAWARFLTTYAKNNPYSEEDERLRQEATRRQAAVRDEPEVPERQPFEPEMVQITRGTFMMGSPEGEGSSYEHPQHEVTVGDFAIGKYEVTQGEWRAVMGNNPAYFSSCGERCPVERVSWNDVQEYIAKLNAKTGKTYRLPTEAEWEYACRGGAVGETYCGGNDVDSVAWHYGNSGSKTHPVGQKAPNGFGLFDMTGNVWEWNQDRWHGSYAGAPTDGTAWESGDASGRLLRGCSWISDPDRCRAANRGSDTSPYDILGFRVVFLVAGRAF